MNNNKIIKILGIVILLGVAGLLYFYIKDDNSINNEEDGNIPSNIESNVPSNPTSNKPTSNKPTSNKPTSNKPSNSNSNPTSNNPGNGKKKTFTARFASYYDDVVLSSTSASCETYGDSCEITTPTFTREGYNSVGFNLKKFQDKVTVGMNSKYTLTKDVTLFASTTVTYTGTFNFTRCKEAAGLMNKTVKRSCTSAINRENCDIKVPKCTIVGTYDGFWQKPYYPAKRISNAIENNSTYNIIDDTKFEPYTSALVSDCDRPYCKARNFTISQTFEIGNVLVEYEKGVPKSAVNEHVALLKTFYKRVPFLFKCNLTIFVLTQSTYEKYSIAYGLTTPVSNGKEKTYIDLFYDSSIGGISDNATLHEMSHAWDTYYEYLGNGRISDAKNLTTLYNNLLSKHRIPDDNSKIEWFAGMVTEWYWHYKGYDTSKPSFVGYKSNYTASEKKCTEKLFNCYINLANNNYKGSCSNLSC